MKFTKTELEGVVIVEPAVFGDHRGFFMESWSKRTMEEADLFYDFVQDKLVRCAKGAVLDVAVDLRPSSPTYKKWVAPALLAKLCPLYVG